MTATINTNVSAIAAQNSLRTSGLNQTSAMERLSSGVRINSAKDDAAGLAISTRMTANIRGLDAAIRNANDGISLTQTAEGSLISIGDNLQRIRELAVQSANSTNNTTDRAALNAEAAQLVSEIDRIANNATFNSVKLLDGSYQNQALQVGSGNEANDRITISIGNARASALGVGGGSGWAKIITGTAVTPAALNSGGLTINGYNIGASTSDGVSSMNATGSGIAKANAINAVSGQTGVTATAGATSFTGVLPTATSATNSTDLSINGVAIDAITATTGTDAVAVRGSQTAAAINSKTTLTGVMAKSDSTGKVTLEAKDGRNISIKATANAIERTGLGATYATDTTKTTASTLTFSNMGVGDTVTVGGLVFTASAELTGTQVAAAFSNIKAGEKPTVTGGSFTSGDLAGFDLGPANGAALTAISKTPSNGTGITVSSTNDTRASSFTAADPTIANAQTTETSIITFKTLKAGGSISVAGLTYTAVSETTDAEVAAGFASLKNGATTGTQSKGVFSGTFTGFTTGAVSGVTVTAISTTPSTDVPDIEVTTNYTSAITLSSSTAQGITIGGSATAVGQTTGYSQAVATDSAGVSSVNLATASGSQAALNILDKAINTITDSRASMGAYQNRLGASISNLETSSMNLQASRSRILDTDYAKETTNLAKSQIIQQAATAMLAQANQSAQSVLALLK